VHRAVSGKLTLQKQRAEALEVGATYAHLFK
jgi:hypothetical protein